MDTPAWGGVRRSVEKMADVLFTAAGSAVMASVTRPEAREEFRATRREAGKACPRGSRRAELGWQLLGGMEAPEVRKPGPVISYRLTPEEMAARGWR